MNFKRIFTAIISLVLVVCLLVNVSPVKAEASVLGVIAGVTAIGIAATLILNSAGVVFLPQSQKHIEAVGQAFSASLYQWGTSAEELDAIDDFLGGLTIYEGSGGDPDDDDDWQPRFDIPDLIKRGVALFTAGCIAASSLFPKDYSVEVPVIEEGDIKEGESVDEANAAIAEAAKHPYALFLMDRMYKDGDFVFVAYSDTSPLVIEIDEFGHWDIHTEDKSSFRYYGHYWDWHEWQTDDLWEINPAFAGSPVFFGTSNSLGAPYYVGDIPEKVQSGEYDENNLPLPETIWYGQVIDPDLGAVKSIIELSEGLINGEISFDQYKSYIAVPQVNPDPVPGPSEEPEPEPSEEPQPSEDPSTDLIIPEPGIDTDSLANANPNTFLERLGSYITTPFKWIWTKIETTFETLTRPELWTETIPEIAMSPARWIWEKIETYIVPLLNPDALARPLPEIVAAPFQNLWANLAPKLDALSQSATQAAQNAASQVTEAIKSTVVPDKDYLSDKIEYIRSKYSFADSLMNTGKDFKDFLLTIGQQPPIIYIDLSARRGFYDMGGKIPFIDLTWYAEYKPKMDIILSAFLWMCTIWRTLIVLPGIISGAAGVPGTHDTLPNDLHTWSGFVKQSKSEYDRNHMRFNLNDMKWGRRR